MSTSFTNQMLEQMELLLSGAVGAMYADGHLLFGMSGALFAQPFDSRGLTLGGERVRHVCFVTWPPSISTEARGVRSGPQVSFAPRW